MVTTEQSRLQLLSSTMLMGAIKLCSGAVGQMLGREGSEVLPWVGSAPAVWPACHFRFLSRLLLSPLNGRYALDTETLPLPSLWETGSVFEGRHGVHVKLPSVVVPDLNSIYDPNQKISELTPYTLQVFLASRNAQRLISNLPSKPVQDQTLNDPNKCNPVV